MLSTLNSSHTVSPIHDDGSDVCHIVRSAASCTAASVAHLAWHDRMQQRCKKISSNSRFWLAVVDTRVTLSKQRRLV
jgi:hypothetical protein